MFEYCCSDVDIFWWVCLKFKNFLWEVILIDGGYGVDVFEFCIIVLFCMNVFKIKFLLEDWNIFV